MYENYTIDTPIFEICVSLVLIWNFSILCVESFAFSLHNALFRELFNHTVSISMTAKKRWVGSNSQTDKPTGIQTLNFIFIYIFMHVENQIDYIK